ncbi:PAS domain S-box protein [Maridesulfovibrio salexigens]|uniref:histidine kinase n=1 Tax=Maridesulfovibrio salexigens (strain ATCC 14822 / DSM 2638 / NCIMB 8403 / VKM B-1763) TaxID=526222 RepID=C6BWG8_MARSD|nr:PAS domain S-box protein [Maridesulfovibrio salexigens]ACS78412.1 PAS/PAC sensor signal transduction histidine kinase [Maridesulfovibrio salexigens DSM 2638]
MFRQYLNKFLRLPISLALKIIISIILLMMILLIGLFIINTQKYEQMAIRNAAIHADGIADVVKAGLRRSMRLDPRDDTNALIEEIQKHSHISSISIYDKIGNPSFTGKRLAPPGPLLKNHQLCIMCHAQEQPLAYAPLEERYKVLDAPDGSRMIRIVTPIANEPGCSTISCHVAQKNNSFLGIVEMTVTLDNIEGNISLLVKDNAEYVLFSLIVIVIILSAITYWLVDSPIKGMIETTRRIALGDYDARLSLIQNDELGELAHAINRMASEVGNQHDELRKQRGSYQSLFEGVPCLITVQDRNYRLIQYNQSFAERFEARPGDYCYRAYKGRDCKCEECPVEKTFADGKPHTTEEVGYYRDGSQAHWIVNTAPIYDDKGEVVAAMEMCLDITRRKRLEVELKASEKKYCAIFNNIPNAVLVLAVENMQIIDCNQTAQTLYGYTKGELIRRSAFELAAPDEFDTNRKAMESAQSLKQTKHLTKEGESFWASTSITTAEFDDLPVLLMVVTDISERIRSEEQLVQASKMATLGEMATGVAHELNQPLATLQIAANIFKRKLKKNAPIERETLENMSAKISNNVGRATKIINHMREFGRKANIETEQVELNEVICRAFDFFSRQLQLHDIDVIWELDDNLPPIQADSNRMEQVFINLLLNARDAILEKCAHKDCGPHDRRITLRTRFTLRHVFAEVIDTGIGIPKHIVPRLFEPFFTTKEVGKGTGLGLSISYGIVTDYGGSIHASSSVLEGSRFVISLPKSKA